MFEYTLPKSSPWVVTIDGQNYVVQSTVARLLLQIEKAAKKAAKKASKAK